MIEMDEKRFIQETIQFFNLQKYLDSDLNKYSYHNSIWVGSHKKIAYSATIIPFYYDMPSIMIVITNEDRNQNVHYVYTSYLDLDSETLEYEEYFRGSDLFENFYLLCTAIADKIVALFSELSTKDQALILKDIMNFCFDTVRSSNDKRIRKLKNKIRPSILPFISMPTKKYMRVITYSKEYYFRVYNWIYLRNKNTMKKPSEIDNPSQHVNPLDIVEFVGDIEGWQTRDLDLLLKYFGVIDGYGL